jgi:hypothetical protein
MKKLAVVLLLASIPLVLFGLTAQAQSDDAKTLESEKTTCENAVEGKDSPLEDQISCMKRLPEICGKLIDLYRKRRDKLMDALGEPGAKHFADDVRRIEEAQKEINALELKKLDYQIKLGAPQAKAKPETVNRSCCEAEKNTGDVKVIVKESGTDNAIIGARVKLLKLDPSAKKYAPSHEPAEISDRNGEVHFKKVDATQTYKLAVTKNYFQPFEQSDSDNFKPSSKLEDIKVELSPQSGEIYRAILGLEQAGASSAQSKQNVFLNFYFSRPLICKDWDGSGSNQNGASANGKPGKCAKRSVSNQPTAENTEESKGKAPFLSIWGDVRLTTTPQQSQNIVKAFDAASFTSLANSGSGQTKLISAASFLAGLQFRVVGGHLGGRRYDFSFIGGGGAITPLSPEDSLDSFIIPSADTDKARRDKLIAKLKETESAFTEDVLNDKTIITFVSKGRDRFLRNYFGGVRLQTYYNDVAPTRPPGALDITFGQDESVTGGEFGSGVFRIDGFFPLPFNDSKLVYLFGTASMAFKQPSYHDGLLLSRAPDTISPTSDKALVFSIPSANRDMYRIGVGFNLSELFGKPSGAK